ncbi:DUF3526 domain-containing protein [Abyssalbus ytuae]|uniref:DUF3526 domain-containing protein n=1 Tax=Abyssalbus ytuae TaxID=2926907 RepID=A0A9E6ZPQ5_9FLAO|nr:DUF3526 domain-containing protein [Abyssalbus ytuae]UOB18634.1 DUF3526 domain-containing protein [Abyssalbus ytuae]
MFSLLMTQFLRSRTVILSFILIITLGVVSIFIGKQFLSRQEKAIDEITAYQENHIQKNVDFHGNDLGLLLYYLKFTFINKPSTLAGLSIGQSDVNPTVQLTKILNLEGQKYDTDLINPVNLQSGNLDLGFVIIYLFPLLTISILYNLLSEETESGTWRLVAVQTESRLKFLLGKLSVRAGFLYAALILLLLLAKVILKIPFGMNFMVVTGLSILYLTFWIMLCFFLIGFKKSSGFNILVLLSVWLVLIILLPATINNYIAYKYPVPEALSTMIKQRDSYHTKWDADKIETLKSFYDHYPQFESYGYPNEGFTWLWYYAMQQMGDDDAREESQQFRNKIMQREIMSRKIAQFIPNMYTQIAFNKIARTGLINHMDFMDETTNFHERLRLYFYPKIFDGKTADDVNWSHFKPEYFEHKSSMDNYKLLTPLLIFAASVFLISIVKARNI